MIALVALNLSLSCDKKDKVAAEDPQGNESPVPNEGGDDEKAGSSIPDSEITLFKIDTSYYKKYVMLGSSIEASIPILSGAGVLDEALETAKFTCEVLANTLPQPVLTKLRENRIAVVIFGNAEYPDVLPGWDPHWDATRYAGGYGPNAPGATCGIHEGDILNNSFDRYPAENIVVHEFAHAIMDFGLSKIYPDFRTRLTAIWDRAKTKKLWENTYAISNVSEYWAEGIQSYFNLNATGPRDGDGIHNDVSTRERLQAYDPEFYEFIREFYGAALMPVWIK